MWLWLTAFVVVLLQGCGFQLRGANTNVAALNGLFVEEATPDNTRPAHPLVQTLNQILTRSGAVLATSAATATRRLRLQNIEQRRRTVAFSPSGSVRETTLTLVVDYQVVAADGAELLPTTRYSLTRNAVFNEAQVLGATEGEATVIRQMEQDAATAILRQLDTLK